MTHTPASPSAKLKMMTASMHCLVWGMLGLLPIIGVPFALAAFWASYSARRDERHIWNPARLHRIAGLICASLGAFIWGAVDTILIYNIANSP